MIEANVRQTALTSHKTSNADVSLLGELDNALHVRESLIGDQSNIQSNIRQSSEYEDETDDDAASLSNDAANDATEHGDLLAGFGQNSEVFASSNVAGGRTRESGAKSAHWRPTYNILPPPPAEHLEDELTRLLRDKFSLLRACRRLALMVAIFWILVPVYVICRWLGGRYTLVGSWCYGALLWCANIRARVLAVQDDGRVMEEKDWRRHHTGKYGAVSADSTLWIGNHVSYLDVAVIASKFDVAFVAAHREKLNGLAGWVAHIGDTIFVKRNEWAKVSDQVSEVRRVTKSRSRRLVIFGEGTTTDGSKVLPLHSGLLDAVWTPGCSDASPTSDIVIQPFVIGYSSFDGRPLSPLLRDTFAWYGLMPFWRHFIRAIGLKGVLVIDLLIPPVIHPMLVKDGTKRQRRQKLAKLVHASLETGHQYLRCVGRGDDAAARAMANKMMQIVESGMPPEQDHHSHNNPQRDKGLQGDTGNTRDRIEKA